jgi:hypothetical protein
MAGTRPAHAGAARRENRSGRAHDPTLEGDGLRRPRTESVRLLAEALELTDAEQALLIAAARADNSAVDVEPDVPHQLPADVPGFAGRGWSAR